MKQADSRSFLASLYGFVVRYATWPTITLLFTGFLLSVSGFTLRAAALGPDNKALDARFFYRPDQVRDLLEALGQRGRSLYAISEVTLDLVFPFLYAGILAVLIVNLYDAQAARSLLLAPLFGMTADLLENITAATLAWTYNGQSSPLARVRSPRGS
jgi:hypothetical protein